MTDYRYTLKGRGAYASLTMVFVVILGTLFFLTKDPIFRLIGVFFLILAISGLYAFLKGEEWSLQVQNGILTWSYPRWPKSSGSINLSEVSEIIVNDCSSTLFFTFKDGTKRKIRLVGNGARFRDYLKSTYPNISLEFVEGT